MKLITFLLRMAKTTGGKFYKFLASRGRNPGQNLIILLGIFGALCINYFQGYSGSFIFEVEFLNQMAFHAMLIPLLLFVNSFLFKKV